MSRFFFRISGQGKGATCVNLSIPKKLQKTRGAIPTYQLGVLGFITETCIHSGQIKIFHQPGFP